MNVATPAHFAAPADPLAGLFCLSERVAITVPSTVDVFRPASPEAVEWVRRRVASALAEWFGGYTETPGHGGYVSHGGKLIREAVTVVAAFCSPDALAERLADVVALAAEVAERMGQESVALEVNGRLYFVTAQVAVPA